MWEKRWTTISDAAKILGRSRQTVHNWINRGVLQAKRFEGRTFVPLKTQKKGHVTENTPDFRAPAKK